MKLSSGKAYFQGFFFQSFDADSLIQRFHHVLSISPLRVCTVYDLLTGAIVRAIASNAVGVCSVAWHPHRAQIVSASIDGVVNVSAYIGADDDAAGAHELID